MIGKIVKGTSFGGCVNYVLKEEKSRLLEAVGIEVSLFDFMENNATDEERKAGYDIADFLLKAETKESVLSRMIARNPHLETLITTLDLEVVGVEKLS